LLKAENQSSDVFRTVARDFERMLSQIAGKKITIDPIVFAAGGAVVAGTAAIAGMTAQVIALGSAMDDLQDKIIITTGASGAALAGLQQDFAAVAASVPNEMGQVADAIGQLAVRTGQTGESLQTLARQQLALSRITGTDLGGNIRATTRLFGDWGVASEDQARVLDQLFIASQKSGASINQLAQNVVQFGAPMRQLGISLDESIALFASWEREGVNVETVAGTMRIAVARLAEAGLEPQAVFRDLLITIRDMEDPLRATSLAMQVFGQRGGADMAAAIREGKFSVDEFVAAMAGAEGAITRTAEATDDGTQKMATALNRLRTVFAPVGQAAFAMSSDVVSGLATMGEALLGTVTDAEKRRAQLQALQGAGTSGAIIAGAGTAADFAGQGAAAAKSFWDAFTMEHNVRRGLLAQSMIPEFSRDDWRLEGRAAAESFGEGVGEGLRDTEGQADAIISALAGGMAAAFGRGIEAGLARADLEAAFGSEAAAAIAAFTDPLETENFTKTAVTTATNLIRALRAELGERGRTLGEQVANDISAAIAERSETAISRAITAVGEAGQELEFARGAPAREAEARRQEADAQRQAAAAKRAAEQALRDAERAAREAANVAIVGFMEALQANRANINAEFGEIGASAAAALGEAFRRGDAASGASLAREMDQLIDQARREGLPNWREAGNALAAAFHDGLQTRTEEARIAMLAELQQFGEQIRAHRALSPENFTASLNAASLRASFGTAGAALMDGLRAALDEGGERARDGLARSAVSWIEEVRRGLPAERADALVSEFLSTLTDAIETRSPEAQDALGAIFQNTRFEIPRGAIDRALGEATTRIRETRDRAIAELSTSQAIAGANEARRADLERTQREELDRLRVSLLNQAPAFEALPQGINTRAAEIERLSARAEVGLRRQREDADRALGRLREEEDRQAARRTEARPGIAQDELQRMSQAERDAAIRRLNEQVAAQNRQEQADEARIARTRQREEQDIATRRARDEEDANRRFAQEAQIAALRDQQAAQTAAFTRSLEQEAANRQIAQINERAATEQSQAERKHADDLRRLDEQTTILTQMTAVADGVFDNMLIDIEQLVERTRTMADALAAIVPGGIAAAPAAPAPVTGEAVLPATVPAPPAAPAQPTTVDQSVHATFNNYGTVGAGADPEDLLAAMTQAGLAAIRAGVV
jgi:TP901 family phage tail tape measure protein